MSNNALIAMDKSGSYRVYLAITTEMVEEARQIHNTTPLATAGLGRVLTGAGLMGLLLKGKRDKLTVQFKGDGPARQILATANADGTVKGYIANPDVDLPLTEAGKLDVGGSLGIGELTVIKDLGLKEPYIGSIALVTGEIADDLTAYYYISEQQNSAFALGVKVDVDYTVAAAGGMVIQMLPDFEEAAVDALEAMLGEMKPLTTLITEVYEENPGADNQILVTKLLEKIFEPLPEEYQVRKLEERHVMWQCDCSRERMEKALIAIGEADLREITEEDEQAELTCQFCTKAYQFNKQELEELLKMVTR
ncbi:MAG: Hsp33 family molecular chaperone HslO [Firmicutes bacterium]|nr:Hsp33 family molecular chaperone HslO [Bacillota bacterium]